MMQFWSDAWPSVRWWIGTIVVGGLLTALGLRDLGGIVLLIYCAVLILGAILVLLRTWHSAARRAEELSHQLARAQRLSEAEREQLIDAITRASEIYALAWGFAIGQEEASSRWVDTIQSHVERQRFYARRLAYLGTIEVLLGAIAGVTDSFLLHVSSGQWDTGEQRREDWNTLHNAVDSIRWARDGVVAHANGLLGRSDANFGFPLKPPIPLDVDAPPHATNR